MFYIDFFKCLTRHRVRYLLVGGLAMNLHGGPRMTLDVDIVLVLDEGNLKSFLVAAKEMGLTPTLPVQLADLLDSERRSHWIREKNMVAFPLAPKDPSGPTIDVLIDPPIDIEGAMYRAEYRTVGDVVVPIASIEDMIRLKEQTGRIQDQADVEHLNRLMLRHSAAEPSCPS
jgi:hypothetical protein